MKNSTKKIIAIVGPTASGKTGVGVKLAKEFDGEIVSADSRQVYRGLDLGTGKEGIPCRAKELPITNYQSPVNDQLPIGQSKNKALGQTTPTPLLVKEGKIVENLRRSIRRIDGVSQWLIDVADPGERFTLFDYLPLARIAIEDILKRGKTPIIVGGTGLYIQGLLEGFEIQDTRYKIQETNDLENSNAKISDNVIPDLIRDPGLDSRLRGNDTVGSGKDNICVRKGLDSLSLAKLQKILKEIDPKAFKTIDQNNPHRLIRAIERAQRGEKMTKQKPDWDILQIGLDLPREELYSRIDRRVDERFEEGMGQEVSELLKQGVDPKWLIGLGLEYREITDFLLELGIMNHESEGKTKNHNSKFVIHNSEFQLMSQQLKFKSHQYARRQLTWFRKFPEIRWLNDYADIEGEAKIFLENR